MIKTFQFRFYPTRKQEEVLKETLALARWAYNMQLELKIKAYNKEGVNLSQFDLNNNLKSLKSINPELTRVHSQVLQNINFRITKAFEGFFKRVKQGEKAGFPRFKSEYRYDSITYPQSGFCLKEKLYVSKIGELNIIKHRNIEGMIKTLTLRRTRTNKWFVSFIVEKSEKNIISKEERISAIDLGLLNFFVSSEGDIVNNPRYLKKGEKRLIQLQRSHSHKKRGSKNRQKSRLKVARQYEKIRNRRLDFLHKETRILVNKYSHLAVENLKIKGMMKNRYLSNSISDASWGKFLQLLEYKAEEAGTLLVKVNPKGTSQYCVCGKEVRKNLAVRTHNCSFCGANMDRDIMSAILIKKIAFNKYVPSEGRELRLGRGNK